jgi:hypothetical protein
VDEMSGFFGLNGSEYWVDPWKNLSAIAWDTLVNRTEGLTIDAPDFVPLEERKTIPLLAFQSGNTEDLARAPFEKLAVVALVNVDANRVLASRLPRPTQPPPPAAPASPGFAGVEYDVPLTELFNLPWERGTWVATVFIRDRASNRVTIRLGNSPSGYHDPEVERFLEAQRAKQPPRAPFPPVGDAALRYAGSVAPPDTLGMALGVERVVVATPDAQVWLDIGFRLPVAKTDVLPPPAQSLGANMKPATARAVITLLVFGSDSNVPRVVPLVLPSFDAVTGAPDAPVAVGRCSVDLAKLAGLALEPQTYFVYAFSGELMAGAAAVALVDPKLVPSQS